MTRLALAALLLAACARHPAAAEPEPAATRHCIRVAYKADDEHHQLLACLDTAVQCRRSRNQIIKYGHLARVVQVGACKAGK